MYQLRLMFGSYRFGRFNFNYYAVFNYQISYIFANHISFIPLYLYTSLLKAPAA